MYDCNGCFAQLCIVSNFSNGGAKIAGVEPDTVPDDFILRISPRGRPHKCHVTRRSKDGLGVEFVASARELSELTTNRRLSVAKVDS
jgi:hypothetical protein